MEEFKEPRELSDEELLELRDALSDELHWLCLRRWVLFDQIDLLRSEKVRRLRDSLAGAGAAALVAEPDYRSLAGRAGAFSGCGNADPSPWDREPLAPLPPVPSLGIERIRELLHSTKDVENDVSMRRQIAWARLQAVEAEISRRFDEGD
jgi:RsiG-like